MQTPFPYKNILKSVHAALICKHPKITKLSIFMVNKILVEKSQMTKSIEYSWFLMKLALNYIENVLDYC